MVNQDIEWELLQGALVIIAVSRADPSLLTLVGLGVADAAFAGD